MANHKSAEKRARQNEKRRLRNRTRNTTVKNKIRTVLESIGTKSADEVKAALEEAVKVIDKARSAGVLHRNNASRKISRLTRRAQAASK
jgi:small subunit ribosomal protein S20